MDPLDAFVGEIIDAKQLSGMNEEVRSQLIVDMKERLIDQINRAMLDALPADKIEAFDQLLERDDVGDETVQAFMRDNGVDAEKVAAKTMLRFRDLYLQPDVSTQES